MEDLPVVTIIGPGNVGAAMGVLAHRAGYRVAAVGSRHIENADRVARLIGRDVRTCNLHEAAGLGAMVLLTVPDNAIEQVCTQLADQRSFVEAAVVVHCSGALGSDVLEVARTRCRCTVGSMHPLQTFPTVNAAIAKLPGSYCFYEGDAQALEPLKRFATHLQLKPIQINRDSKALYHAAAVMACNYLTVIAEAALTLTDRAGIARATAWHALEPLVMATIHNIGVAGPSGALTGPVARGDAATVQRHLSAIESHGVPIGHLYRVMGQLAVDLATTTDSLSKNQITSLRRLFVPGQKKASELVQRGTTSMSKPRPGPKRKRDTMET